MAEKKKFSIIVFSGDYDKAFAAFTIASGAAALNYEVNLFFTFFGLNIIKKRRGRKWLGKDFLARFFNFFMGGRNNLPLSRLNFGGLSPEQVRFRNRIPRKRIPYRATGMGSVSFRR